MDDLLQALLSRATTPIVPQQAIQPAVDSLTEPKLDQSPMMAKLKGFSAGALEGARGLTDPLTLGSMAIPGGLALRGAKSAGKAITGIRQSVPALGETIAEFTPVGGEATYNAGRAASKAPDLMETMYKRLMASGKGNVGIK